MTDSDVTYAGWIFKEGSLRKNWKKRFLVVKKRELAYYKNNMQQNKAQLLGTMTISRVDFAQEITNGLVVFAQDGKQMRFFTDTKEESKKCYHALAAHCHQLDVTQNPDFNAVFGKDDAGHIKRVGWMDKEGHRFKTWKKRYFTLDNNELSYSASMGGDILGRGIVYSVQKDPTRAFTLTIEMEKGKELRIQAKSDFDAEEWMKAMRLGIHRAKSQARQQQKQNNYEQQSTTSPAFAPTRPNSALYPGQAHQERQSRESRESRDSNHARDYIDVRDSMDSRNSSGSRDSMGGCDSVGGRRGSRASQDYGGGYYGSPSNRPHHGSNASPSYPYQLNSPPPVRHSHYRDSSPARRPSHHRDSSPAQRRSDRDSSSSPPELSPARILTRTAPSTSSMVGPTPTTIPLSLRIEDDGDCEPELESPTELAEECRSFRNTIAIIEDNCNTFIDYGGFEPKVPSPTSLHRMKEEQTRLNRESETNQEEEEAAPAPMKCCVVM